MLKKEIKKLYNSPKYNFIDKEEFIDMVKDAITPKACLERIFNSDNCEIIEDFDELIFHTDPENIYCTLAFSERDLVNMVKDEEGDALYAPLLARHVTTIQTKDDGKAHNIIAIEDEDFEILGYAIDDFSPEFKALIEEYSSDELDKELCKLCDKYFGLEDDINKLYKNNKYDFINKNTFYKKVKDATISEQNLNNIFCDGNYEPTGDFDYGDPDSIYCLQVIPKDQMIELVREEEKDIFYSPLHSRYLGSIKSQNDGKTHNIYSIEDEDYGTLGYAIDKYSPELDKLIEQYSSKEFNEELNKLYNNYHGITKPEQKKSNMKM